MSSLPFSVMRWRDLADQMRGDIPLEFILAWIRRESGGNQCAIGETGATDPGGQVLESGLFQLWSPDNIKLAGTTVAKMRVGCGPVSSNRATSEAIIRNLTPDEAKEHMRAGIQYINHCRGVAASRLGKAGVTWPRDSQDFWSAVKLVHALPGLLNPGQVAKKLGRPPKDWPEFKTVVLALDFSAFDKGTARYKSQFMKILDNAEDVGGAVKTGVV